VEDNNGDNVGILSISMFGGSLLDLVAVAQLALLAPMIFQDPWYRIYSRFSPAGGLAFLQLISQLVTIGVSDF